MCPIFSIFVSLYPVNESEMKKSKTDNKKAIIISWSSAFAIHLRIRAHNGSIHSFRA